jgi:3-hydroxyisobutyrate dehydrogenase
VIVEPGRTRVGWIGTGVMGSPMCGHLIAKGFAATVHNRTRTRTSSLVERGAVWAESPREVAERSDVVFVMVGLPAEVREALLGPEGALAGARPGLVVVDMGTGEPSFAVEVAERARERGAIALDAPVSGGDVGAREARLSIMIGGDREAAESLRPIWETLGRTWVWQGGPGSGQHTKLVNQILIATNMIGVCEALLYAHRAGLDLDRVFQSVASGAAGSWSLSNYGPRIVRGDFEPGFLVDHFVKDMAIALTEARRMKLALPGLALAQQLYVSLQAVGLGRKGTHALQLALARLSNVDWNAR